MKTLDWVALLGTPAFATFAAGPIIGFVTFVLLLMYFNGWMPWS